jgi:hypothetical protein
MSDNDLRAEGLELKTVVNLALHEFFERGTICRKMIWRRISPRKIEGRRSS